MHIPAAAVNQRNYLVIKSDQIATQFLYSLLYIFIKKKKNRAFSSVLKYLPIFLDSLNFSFLLLSPTFQKFLILRDFDYLYTDQQIMLNFEVGTSLF